MIRCEGMRDNRITVPISQKSFYIFSNEPKESLQYEIYIFKTHFRSAKEHSGTRLENTSSGADAF